MLGILASRVVDRTGRPALILTHEEGQAHGSGRSVQGFHLLDALTAIDLQADASWAGGIFTRFGGHAHAVGFSLPSLHLENLRTRMRAHTDAALTTAVLNPAILCDGELTLAEITPGLWHWLERCGPFGNAHAEPIFLTRGVALASSVRIIKDKHICLELTDDGGTHPLNALGWSRSIDWPARCRELDLKQGSRLDIVYRLQENQHERFGGLQLELIDLQPV